MQEIGLENSLVDALISGRKMVEPRLARGRYKTFNIGDKLSIRRDIWEKDKVVKSTQDAAFVEIIGIFQFPSFKDLIDFVGFKRVIPTARTKRHATKIFRRFYSKEDMSSHNVIAFEINLLAVIKK